MLKISAAVATSVLAALLVVGVAWAGGDDSRADSSVEVTTPSGDASTSTSATSRATSGSVEANSSISVTIDDRGGATSTTVDGDGSTSTMVDGEGLTSTSVDDDSEQLADQVLDFDVSGAATVTIRVIAGRLVLVDIDLRAGWHQEIKKLETDEIEIRFEKGDSRAELEVEVDDGRVEWEVDAG